MENIKSIESNFQRKNHDKVNSSKIRRRKKNYFGKDDDDLQEITIGPENICRKRNIKLNSIDNSQVLHNNFFDKHPATLVEKKEKNNKQKNGNMVTEYLTKLYDEPHLSKSLFRKKTTKIRNPNRKVSFINPINSKSKQNMNVLNINKSLFKKHSENYNKSRIFNDNDFLADQSYGYNKEYDTYLIDSNDLMLKSEIITDKKKFNTRNIRRKQTSKTNKVNNKKLFNLGKIRNPKKKNTSNTDKEFYSLTKKHLSSKSNNNKRVKKESKTPKNKNNKDKDYDKIININNNIHINNSVNKNRNDDNEITKKSKKKQDIDDIETAIQKGQKEKNDKKKKKQSCCFPFLVCLKFKNDKENENIL